MGNDVAVKGVERKREQEEQEQEQEQEQELKQEQKEVLVKRWESTLGPKYKVIVSSSCSCS